MSDNRKFTPAPRVKNALDNAKLKLSAPSTASGKYANMVFSIVSNNPRITVYTGDPDDNTEKNGYGKIQANLDIYTWYAFLEKVKQIAATKEETKIKFENLNFTWFGGKRSEKPVVVSELWVGRDAQGVMWVSVLSSDSARPKIKFPFGPTTYHRMITSDGQPVSKPELSSIYALSFARALDALSSQIFVKEYTEPKQKENNSGGFRQNPGNTERSGDRNASAASVSEDDMPW